MKVIMEYTQEGETVNDFFLEEEAKKITETVLNIIDLEEDADMTLPYSTSNIFYAIREKVVLGIVPYSGIVFKHDNTVVPINEFGAMLDDFPDSTLDYAESIVSKAMKLRKAKREKAETNGTV